jgi:hypothetical protein
LQVHVTLIQPPKITTDFSPHTQSGVPPLALACLAAALAEAGHGVSGLHPRRGRENVRRFHERTVGR